jgi:hypothetical protein
MAWVCSGFRSSGRERSNFCSLKKIEDCRLKIYGIARAAQALAPRVALSFLSKSIAFLKYSIFNRFLTTCCQKKGHKGLSEPDLADCFRRPGIDRIGSQHHLRGDRVQKHKPYFPFNYRQMNITNGSAGLRVQNFEPFGNFSKIYNFKRF